MTSDLKLREMVQSLEARVKKLEDLLLNSSGRGAVPSLKDKQLSAREFLQTKALNSDVQRVLVLGYFLEHMSGMESFNVSDLEEAFRAAKERLPKNLNDSVNKNIRHGFIMDAREKKDSKKAWCLTSTGEDVVTNTLSKPL